MPNPITTQTNSRWTRPVGDEPVSKRSRNGRSSHMPAAFGNYKPLEMKVFGAICVNANGEVLLVRGRHSGKWSFPKGHMKPHRNETGIQCARRELFEETGLIAPTNYESYHRLRGAEYFVFAMGTPQTIQPRDNHEICEVSWWPLQNLPTMDSNIDVSIFRTLMRDCGVEKRPLDFLESDEAHKRTTKICKAIEVHSG